MAAIQHCRDYVEMSRRAAETVMAVVAKKRDALLCLPTGNSPAGLYEQLAATARTDPRFMGGLRIIKLDEWLGVPASDPASCEHFLQNRVLRPLGIDAGRYTAFDAAAPDPQRECARISAALAREGPIDLCILGLGRNGHLGLNEPGPRLQPHCHVAMLSEMTRSHGMVAARKDRPTRGLTLGVADLLQSRKILLLITGSGKESAVAGFLEGNVTTELPATLLHLHPDVEVLLDDGGAR